MKDLIIELKEINELIELLSKFEVNRGNDSEEKKHKSAHNKLLRKKLKLENEIIELINK